MQGVPLKVTLRGIDRYFERYYRKGPRRRPVRVDFCEADVLDVFDEWRRATGIVGGGEQGGDGGEDAGSASTESRRGPSLPAHIERVLVGLTNARATDRIGQETDPLLDRVSSELDAARRSAGGLRGDARRALIERLAALDHELLAVVRSGLNADDSSRMNDEAAAELAPYRAAMSSDAYDRARAAVLDRLVRDRFMLPTVTFE